MALGYILKNRTVNGMSHGEQRQEFITYDLEGRETDRLEITASTARWIAGNSGLEFISPARAYALTEGFTK